MPVVADKSYDLFRGPDPRHYGRLKTFDEWWAGVLAEKWLHDHIVIGKPEFVGRMPQRVDLEVLPAGAVEQVSDAFRGWTGVQMTLRRVKPTRWSRLVWRIKKALGLFPKGDREMRLI